jgi:hypothetical protein
MKVLCLADPDYEALRKHLECQLHWWSSEVMLADAFQRTSGIKWHAAARLRLRRRKAYRLLEATKLSTSG